jgi:hypothetical protein
MTSSGQTRRKEGIEMRTPRSLVFAAAAAAAVTTAALIVPSLSAQTPENALANFTPTVIKLYHTGGTVPSVGYADVDRLAIPAGSYALTAHMTIEPAGATAPTQVDCFLVYPGTRDYPSALTPNLRDVTPTTQSVKTEVGVNPSSRNGNRDLTITALTTTATGGNVDLLCRVTNPSDDRGLDAGHASIVAVPVSGTTVTSNLPPAEGSY